ncbi:MAG: hypothetical protein PHT12_05240 [Patescibacteria group bacterium]|nr:hypothetical protein [Patescibacteria group bacterium]
MFGKPQWFKRRKYGGWGLVPATWQGWAYIAIMALAILGLQYLPVPEDWIVPAMVVVAGIFAIDVLHVMANVATDERERVHEAVAERNAMWAVIVTLCAGIGWQVASSSVGGETAVDPVIVGALVVAVITKAVTNIYLDRKD